MGVCKFSLASNLAQQIYLPLATKLCPLPNSVTLCSGP